MIRLRATIGVALLTLTAGGVQAQEVVSPLVPRGVLRLDIRPSVLTWNGRFGIDGDVEGIEELGWDVTDPAGFGAFPGGQEMREAIRGLVGDELMPMPFGTSRAEVTLDRIQLDLKTEVGVFDWLTAGFNVPLIKARTEAIYSLRADSSDVGINPAITAAADVIVFLDEADRALAELRTLQGSASVDAELVELIEVLTATYRESVLFPADGSLAADALQAKMDSLNMRLGAEGVDPITVGLPLAATALSSTEQVQDLLTGGTMGFLLPLQDVPGVWELGDVEAFVRARVLGNTGQTPDSTTSTLWEVGAGGLVRLGTGTRNEPNLLYDVDPADGQMDIEGKVWGLYQTQRYGAWGQLTLGIQQSTTLERRVAPHDVRFTTIFTRGTVDWTPGNTMRLEVAPHLRVADGLRLLASYEYFHEAASTYELTGPLPGIPAQDGFTGFLGPSYGVAALEAETEQTVHELGGGLVYNTTRAWLAGETGLPFEVSFVMRKRVSGSGGRTPAGVRAVVGLRVFRTLWGGPAN